jgi:NADH:ubiquinone oxidoreductase subunit D
MCCGARLTVSYIRYGGVSRDIPEDGIAAIRKFVEIMPERIDEYERLLTSNEIFVARTRNVGILPPELAIASSVTGPVLRASGIPYDVRRAEPYNLYDRFDFDIPVRYNGDCYDRYMIRVAEMRQSVRIIEQALRDLPEGEIKAKLSRLFRPARASAYARTESPKGELGFYIVADGKVEPYRFHIRPPSFINLTVLEPLLIGHKVADVVVILGSIDIVMGEVDR